MAFNIESIKRIYEEEELNFSFEPESKLIRFSMNTEASSDVRFIVRIVNARTVLFTTILPMNIPEKMRSKVSEYINRVNYDLLLGNFQMDFSDGEFSYKAAAAFEEDFGLSDETILRLTYVGFNMFDAYVPALFSIIYGGKTPLEAFEEAEKDDEDDEE